MTVPEATPAVPPAEPFVSVQNPAVLVVMGVSGSGKTTVAQALAQRTGWIFQEGDDLHPESNIAKMAAGIPLVQADREPWLSRIATWIQARLEQGQSGIITCSALQRWQRDRLRGLGVVFVSLEGSREQIAARLRARRNHFMPASLLDSQFEALEPVTADEKAIRISIETSLEEQVEQIISALGLSQSPEFPQDPRLSQDPVAGPPGASLAEQVDQLLESGENGQLPPIVRAGHPALRRAAEPWQGQLDSGRLHRLINLMREVMHRAPGVGLAAPQLGLSLQLAVAEDQYDVPEEVRHVREREPLPFLVMINPRYTAGPPLAPAQPVPEQGPGPANGDGCPGHRQAQFSTQFSTQLSAEFYEGCLSVPGYQAVVPRLRSVRLSYLDGKGSAQQTVFRGWAARIIQHEADHLAGTLYLDKAIMRSLSIDSSDGYSNDEYPQHQAGPDIAQARLGLGF